MCIRDRFLIRYANKIRKNPQLSPMYDLDQKNALAKDLKLEDFGTMTPRKWICLLYTSLHDRRHIPVHAGVR